MKWPALFLDRDGVINVDHGYVHDPENFEFIDGIFDLVREANFRNYKVIVVTNQAGIGRGYYTEHQFHVLTQWMLSQFALRNTHIDHVYFCPFHPSDGIGKYRCESELRKPAPGMLLKAKDEHRLDLASSILVGDKLSDMQAGQRAGVGRLFYYGDDYFSENVSSVTRLEEITKYLRTIEKNF